MPKIKSSWFMQLLGNLFTFIIGLVILLPLLYAFFGSFKENMELMTSTKILPNHFTFDNYIYAWKNVNFSRYTINSLIVTCVCVVASIFISSMPAYVFSRRMKKMPFLKTIRKVYIASMFISLGPCTLYPIFKLVVDLNLNNTLWGIILTHIGAQVANILLIEGYLHGIGKDFDEAATIDGCGFFSIYIKIILPLIRPVIAVVALLTFRGVWNSYLMPMVLTMGNPDLRTLVVAVIDLQSSGSMATQWSTILAGANMSILPILLMYILANKQFISGITLGGIKG